MRNSIGAIGAVILVAACGGGGGSSTTATTTPPTATTTNSAPTVSTAVANQAANVGFDFSLDLSGTFSDADNDALTITAEFGADAKGLALNGSEISGRPDSTGTVTVTCTATDPDGASASDTFTIDVTVDQSAISATFSGAVDLDNLEDYANQTVPNYITKINDGGNPITNAGATLGRVLFYDTSLSTDGTISCATCHVQSLGFSDPGIVRRRANRPPFHAPDKYNVRG